MNVVLDPGGKSLLVSAPLLGGLRVQSVFEVDQVGEQAAQSVNYLMSSNLE